MHIKVKEKTNTERIRNSKQNVTLKPWESIAEPEIASKTENSQWNGNPTKKNRKQNPHMAPCGIQDSFDLIE